MAYAPRILIVDDETVVREVFTSVLAEDGYFVTSVGTARHALLLLRDMDFDLIVLDISLPDCDGVEVIRQLRCEFPHLKIIAASGFMGRSLGQAVMAAGVTSTLAKPATPNQLRRVVYGTLDPSVS